MGGSKVVRALEGTVTSSVMSAESSWMDQVESKGEALTTDNQPVTLAKPGPAGEQGGGKQSSKHKHTQRPSSGNPTFH